MITDGEKIMKQVCDEIMNINVETQTAYVYSDFPDFPDIPKRPRPDDDEEERYN